MNQQQIEHLKKALASMKRIDANGFKKQIKKLEHFINMNEKFSHN